MKKLLILALVLALGFCDDFENRSTELDEENSKEEYFPPKTHEENDGDEAKGDGNGEDHAEDGQSKVDSVPQSAPPQSPKAVNPAEGINRSGRIINSINNNDWDSLTSPYAPPDGQETHQGLPYIVTEARLKKLREEFMYWYWDQGGNSDNSGDFQSNIHSSTPTVHKNLNFQLPFFGFRFNYTRVSLNGYLEFSDPPENYPSYPLVFPNKDWPKKNDPSFIGIFFSKCRIGALHHNDVDRRRAGVYFRLERDLQTRKDLFGSEVRERLTWDIRTGVIGADSFEPKHAIIVTWKNVSFAGGVPQAMYKTNTFQLVLATDEVMTYAIFNYKDLKWTTHTEANGDTLNGEGGIPAYVGFNAGNGTRSYEYKPYSQAPIIRDLTGKGMANGFPGRHIFRIDENIMLGTCNKDIDDANLPLVIAPERYQY